MSDEMTKCKGSIIKETEKAIRFQPDDDVPPLWIPKSQCEQMGDTLWVASWLASQEGLGE